MPPRAISELSFSNEVAFQPVWLPDGQVLSAAVIESASALGRRREGVCRHALCCFVRARIH